MDSQYAPLVRWVLNVAMWAGFAATMLLPTVLGLSVAIYTLFVIGYSVGYLVVPFLTWGRVFPAPRRPDRSELESACLRRCQLWHIVYSINGTRYLLPQFVSTIGWIVLVGCFTGIAILLATILR